MAFPDAAASALVHLSAPAAAGGGGGGGTSLGPGCARDPRGEQLWLAATQQLP